jgi:hypothetical protein
MISRRKEGKRAIAVHTLENLATSDTGIAHVAAGIARARLITLIQTSRIR